MLTDAQRDDVARYERRLDEAVAPILPYEYGALRAIRRVADGEDLCRIDALLRREALVRDATGSARTTAPTGATHERLAGYARGAERARSGK